MIRRLGIPESIKAAGIEKEDFERVLDEMAEAAYQDSCTRTNPRACSKDEIRELFMRAYTGKLN